MKISYAQVLYKNVRAMSVKILPIPIASILV